MWYTYGTVQYVLRHQRHDSCEHGELALLHDNNLVNSSKHGERDALQCRLVIFWKVRRDENEHHAAAIIDLRCDTEDV